METLQMSNKPAVLEATPSGAGPSKLNCSSQLSTVHTLHDSEQNYEQRQFDMSMSILRNHEGMGPPLRHCMDLFAARQIGRLPFLESSHLMEDVLLGNDEKIEFSDFLNLPMESEVLRQPHMVVEKSIGIL